MRKRIGILAAIFALFASVSAFAETLTLEQNLANAAAKIGKAIDGKVKTVAVLNIRSEHWALSDYIVEMLNDEFVNTLKKTAVVERDEQSLSLIQQETDYQYSGAVSDATIQSVGAALGADCIVLGNMETVSGGWQLIIRATAVESKMVLASWRGKVSDKEKEVKFQVEKSKKSPRPNSAAKSGADQGKSQKKKTTTKKKPDTKRADEYYSLGLKEYNAKNYAQAFKHFKKAADLGHAAGMAAVGEGYLFGEGVAQNCQKAVEFFKKAADLGNADALFNLGYCYEDGNGVPQNKAKALEYYRKAAAKDNFIAEEAVRRLESQVSSSSSSQSSGILRLFGLEAGISTVSDLERVGRKNAEDDWYDISEKAAAYYEKSSSVFMGANIFHSNGEDSDWPSEWKSAGYNPSFSYNEWVSFLKNQGFSVEIRKSPSVDQSGYFKAVVEGTKEFPRQHNVVLSFGFKKGDASTRDTLDSAYIWSSIDSSASSYNGWLFPIFGLELGKSKESEVRRKCEKKVGERDYYVQGHDFECNESGVLCWVQFFNTVTTKFPDELTNKGYKSSYTYGEWKSFIKSRGYTITKEDRTSIYANKNTPMKHILSVSLSEDGRTESLVLSF